MLLSASKARNFLDLTAMGTPWPHCPPMKQEGVSARLGWSVPVAMADAELWLSGAQLRQTRDTPRDIHILLRMGGVSVPADHPSTPTVELDMPETFLYRQKASLWLPAALPRQLAPSLLISPIFSLHFSKGG